MRAVLMAGGAGTRLRELTKDEIPKPMLPVEGKPILEWQIEELKKYGFNHFTLIIGHLGEKVREYFGNGEKLGTCIDYILEETPLGTAGAFFYLGKMLKESGDNEFFMAMGDIFFNFDVSRMVDFHHANDAFVTLLAHPNMHPYDSDLIKTETDGRVLGFDSKSNTRDYWYDNLVNAGIFMMNAKICDYVPEPKKVKLEKELISGILDKEKVYAYRTPEFIRDIGTVDRVEKTLEDIRSGLVEAKNLKNKQKAIFLDRDGTVNVYNGFIAGADALELEEGAAEAVRIINSSGYLAIMATNQPVLARGETTFEEYYNIMNKMKTKLGEAGAYLDDIFFCPHHPDKGFAGEIPELKIVCSCRKPKPGMLLAAAEKYNIDLSESWMIGDMTQDIKTAENAGTHSCLVRTGAAGSDGKFEVHPDLICDNLLTAVKTIVLQHRKEE